MRGIAPGVYGVGRCEEHRLADRHDQPSADVTIGTAFVEIAKG